MSEHIASDATISQPPLLLSADDYDRLIGLARAAAARHPADDAQRLLDELYRADTVPSDWMPPDIVTMNAYVGFRNDHTGGVRCAQLVYPHEADISRGRISVLSPVGTALLGLAEGQSIGWCAAGGRRRKLTVLRVSDQPFELVQDLAA